MVPKGRFALALFVIAFCAVAPAKTFPQGDRPAPAATNRADVAAFRARVEAALAAEGADKGYWGALVADASTGEVLYALNAQRYFAPASNTKLFSTALAMATLGPDYRFRTTIETHGTVDGYGRLRGDLVLVGRGDPNLSNRKFPYAKEVERDGAPDKVLAELADAVVARGVKQIEGDIVADDSYFENMRFPSGWTIDDMMWGYGAAVSALSLNDNTIFLELRPGAREGDPAWFAVEPWAGYYRVQNEVTTSAPGSERKLEVSREPGSRLFVLRGSIPARTPPQSLTLAVEEPAEHAAHLVKRLLEARGVRIYGEPRARHLARPEVRDTPEVRSVGNGASQSAATVLAEHVSVPLAQAARVANKISLNLQAELLLRAAAREKTGDASAEAAMKYLGEFLKSVGVAESDALLFDGSGLSRRNLVTPEAVVALLQYVSRQPWAETFRSTLPIAGQDGTLADRMKGTAAEGRVWAKTGSLEHVNSLSGYATTIHGAKVVFSIFGNNHALRGNAATALSDAICVAMVEELGALPGGKKKR